MGSPWELINTPDTETRRVGSNERIASRLAEVAEVCHLAFLPKQGVKSGKIFRGIWVERGANSRRAEFQKIIDHRGIVLNAPIGALAHLGLARAFVLQGDAAKSRVAYRDFLSLWEDGDPDIPILKQAKAEYAKLP